MYKLNNQFILLFIFLSLNLHSQNCDLPNSFISLEGEKTKAYLGIGDLWSSGSSGKFFFPKTPAGLPQVPAIRVGAYWIGATDAAGNLKVSAQTDHRQRGKTAFWPGPGNQQSSCKNWDRHFKIGKTEVDAFLLDLADGTIDDAIHPSILAWPAKGNPHFESFYLFELPDLEIGLAPFFDNNADGLYDPEKGDYPLTKGADKMVWWMMNDFGNMGDFDAVQMVIQTTARSYSNSDPALNKSSVYTVKLINSATETLYDGVFSLWLDPDFGCPIDDFAGCLPEENLVFIYNSDEVDGEICTCPGGLNTYCKWLPVLGIKLLEGFSDSEGNEKNMSSFLAYRKNTTGGSIFSHPPSTADQHFNMMKGLWRNGNIIVQDGEDVKHMYAGNPSDQEAYTFCTSDESAYEQLLLLNFEYGELQPGASNEMTFALTGIEDVEYPCPDITQLVEQGNRLKEKFRNCDFTTASNEPEISMDGVAVSPNPFSVSCEIDLLDPHDLIDSYWIFDINGKLASNQESLNNTSFEVSAENLISGMYFYKIRTRSNKLIVGKLILN